MAIDSRLLDCKSQPEIEENFHRVLLLFDGLKVVAVNFDSAGGSSIAMQFVLNGGKATEPTAPTKAGNTFAGWYNGDAAWDFDTPITDSITLTAHWTAA